MSALAKLRNLLLISTITVLLCNCSSRVNTQEMNADEYYKYSLSLYNSGDYEDAITEFKTVILQFPGSAVIDESQYYLGMSYFGRKEYILAANEFSKLIRDLASSKHVPDAQYMLADCYYQLSPPYQLDQEYTKKCIEEYQAFLDFFPKDERAAKAAEKISEMDNKLAEKEFNAARIYERMDYKNAAIKYYGIVVDTYHDTKFAPTALYKKILLLMDKKKNQEALDASSQYMQKYPAGEEIDRVKELNGILSK